MPSALENRWQNIERHHLPSSWVVAAPSALLLSGKHEKMLP